MKNIATSEAPPRAAKRRQAPPSVAKRRDLIGKVNENLPNTFLLFNVHLPDVYES